MLYTLNCKVGSIYNTARVAYVATILHYRVVEVFTFGCTNVHIIQTNLVIDESYQKIYFIDGIGTGQRVLAGSVGASSSPGS